MFEIRLLTVLLSGAFGAVLGSFINVLAIRWHQGASLGGRSACMSCKTTLKPRHLVPIVSWLALRGRCATCSARIHPQYVLVETAAFVLAVIAALRWDPSMSADLPRYVFELVIGLGLLVPVIMDLRWEEIPVEYVLGLGALGALMRAGISAMSGGADAALVTLAWSGVAACIATVVFGGQILISRGKWLGTGDLWMGLGMAGILGPRDLAVALYFAYVLGGLAALILLATGAVKRGARLPFAPALMLGTLFAIWFGADVAAWSLHAFT